MKEQIHAPIGEGSDKTEKNKAPKSLSKPMVPKGLENVQVKKDPVVGYRCWCGMAGKGHSACKVIPIHSDENWSGGDSYDGNGRSGRDFSADELVVLREKLKGDGK